jgi:hypothetical protein
MAKKYRSEAAKKMDQQRSSRPPRRDSKKFKSGSNPHHGGSLGDSGKPARRK